MSKYKRASSTRSFTTTRRTLPGCMQAALAAAAHNFDYEYGRQPHPDLVHFKGHFTEDSCTIEIWEVQ